MTVPDPDVVQKLNDLHIEDADIVASILAKHGLTICEVDDAVTDCTD